MGVTLGVLQNKDHWIGEGDDMIFVDDETKPVITGTGTEDYINGAWDFGGNPAPSPLPISTTARISSARRNSRWKILRLPLACR